jgi:hypothetical protein
VLLIVAAKISLAVKENKPFTNKKANRQEKKRKSVKYFYSEHTRLQAQTKRTTKGLKGRQ